MTGRYFGCEAKNADEEAHTKAKQEKIEQIHELELLPMFVRFSYEDSTSDQTENSPVSAYVAFQKEVFAENWNMVHVTEISFTVNSSDFEEFEKMAGVSLTKDFRDLTSTSYNGSERRKERR